MAVTLHTNMGDLKLELFLEDCPKACENFMAHCASGYYDGTLFHRNIKGFIVQGGDPTNTGQGGESIWKAPFKDEIVPHLIHSRRGMVSMANSGPDTNQSQFFITYAKHEHLNNVYTLFGHVIGGHATLDAMERVQTDPQTDKPLAPLRLNSVTIHANPLADK